MQLVVTHSHYLQRTWPCVCCGIGSTKLSKGRTWFELTFEEFKQYAIETDYLAKKGRTGKTYSIDCKDQTMGYFIGNIRTVPILVNNKKRRMSLVYEFVPEVGRMVATLTNNYNDKIYCSEQDRQ